MVTQHENIVDPYIHEVKGAAAASADQILVADGAGSASFTNPDTLFVSPVYGSMYMTGNATGTSIPTANTYVQIAGNYTAGPLNGVTFASNSLTVLTAGVYFCSFTMTFTEDGGATEEYRLRVGVNGGTDGFGNLRFSLDNNEVDTVSYQAPILLAANDVLYPMITNTTNDAKGATITQIQFSAIKLRNT